MKKILFYTVLAFISLLFACNQLVKDDTPTCNDPEVQEKVIQLLQGLYKEDGHILFKIAREDSLELLKNDAIEKAFDSGKSEEETEAIVQKLERDFIKSDSVRLEEYFKQDRLIWITTSSTDPVTKRCTCRATYTNTAQDPLNEAIEAENATFGISYRALVALGEERCKKLVQTTEFLSKEFFYEAQVTADGEQVMVRILK